MCLAMKIRVGLSLIILLAVLVIGIALVEKTNTHKPQAANVKASKKNSGRLVKIGGEATKISTGDDKKVHTLVGKPISMEWHRDPFVPKKPKSCPVDVCVAASCSALPRKCLADFNNPAESTFAMKSGDKHDGWHDARMGSCFTSCRLAMRKGGLNLKWSTDF